MKFSILIIAILCFSVASAASLNKPKHTELVDEFLEVFKEVLPLVTLAGDAFIQFTWLAAHIDHIPPYQQQISIDILRELLSKLQAANGQHHQISPQLVSQAVLELNEAFVGNNFKNMKNFKGLRE